MNRVCLIQGRPGSGKTVLAVTAPKKPVILVDVDRKAHSTALLQPAIATGDLIIHEVAAPFSKARLDHRAIALAKNEKPKQVPDGWVKFATIIEDIFLKAEKEGKAPGGTLVTDSWTQASEHLKRFIIYHDDRGHATLNDRNWGTFLNMNVEAISGLKDSCARWNMDFIVIVHERVSDIPTAHTTFKRETDGQGVSRRTMDGPTQAIVAPAIEGQFGNVMPSYFAEVYQTLVVVDYDGKPTWRLRIKPDGLRDLRTSDDKTDLEVEPNLEKLWK